TLPEAISRSAITVGLSLLGSTCGVAPSAIWRARLVAASVSSKRFGRNLMQSSTVMRAMEISPSFEFVEHRNETNSLLCARHTSRMHDANQVRQRRLEAFIDNYI